MPQFIDRRQNPKDKHLGNRRRFIRRARAQLKKVVDEAVRDGSISDVARETPVNIPTKGIREPYFHHAPQGGNRQRILPGNREFSRGDRIKKPTGGEGEGGRKGADSGQAEDEFQFALTRNEFLDLFFEDLELPDLVKASLKEIKHVKPRRAGRTTTGIPTNIDVGRTMRNSLGRRIALRRPALREVEALLREIDELERGRSAGDDTDRRLEELRGRLAAYDRRRLTVPFIDPLDVRYAAFQPEAVPNTSAVMFCLMDVSGSMGEHEKDLAKRFFTLLYLFLQRRYEHIDLVFIRHTHEAKEVDEETFFHSRETGGTVVSTALVEMQRIVQERYPASDWNIYAAQASDGENFSSDEARCRSLLENEIMPVCQYYAYVEILDEREIGMFRNANDGSPLWETYLPIKREWTNFDMKRIATPGDIYPVFRELFERARS
jgi:hypothetical protein